jgi:hypothetical protein
MIADQESVKTLYNINFKRVDDKGNLTKCSVRFEVLRAVAMKSTMFLYVTQCDPVNVTNVLEESTASIITVEVKAKQVAMPLVQPSNPQ